MDGRTNAAGAGLNFKVTGSAVKPDRPSENTLWVNTETKITGWVFSAEYPVGTQGLVWVETAGTGTVSFNALRKNSIDVRPFAVQQYESGLWVRKSWALYQNGVWTEFTSGLYLYERGNFYTGVSGGWERYKYSGNPGEIVGLEPEDEQPYISFTGATSTLLIKPSAFDESLIGKYSTLNAEVEVTKITNSTNPYFNLGLVKNYTFTADIGNQWLARASATTVGAHTLSVPLESYTTGKMMLGVFHLEANLYSVWLE